MRRITGGCLLWQPCLVGTVLVTRLLDISTETHQCKIPRGQRFKHRTIVCLCIAPHPTLTLTKPHPASRPHWSLLVRREEGQATSARELRHSKERLLRALQLLSYVASVAKVPKIAAAVGARYLRLVRLRRQHEVFLARWLRRENRERRGQKRRGQK